jgi:hypothetical protein
VNVDFDPTWLTVGNPRLVEEGTVRLDCLDEPIGKRGHDYERWPRCQLKQARQKYAWSTEKVPRAPRAWSTLSAACFEVKRFLPVQERTSGELSGMFFQRLPCHSLERVAHAEIRAAVTTQVDQ